MEERLRDWFDEVIGVGWVWYVKRLSGNDTLLNENHQAGPYIPNRIVLDLFPSIQSSQLLNPRHVFPVIFDSHAGVSSDVTAIWYNNKVVASGTRNESRITNWGGDVFPCIGSRCYWRTMRFRVL